MKTSFPQKLLSFFLLLLVFGGSLGAIIYAQEINKGTYLYLYDEIRRKKAYIPSSDALKAVSFGYENLMADVQFLLLVQHIGKNVVTKYFEKDLYQFLDVITDLDPKFETAYLIGNLLIPREYKEQSKAMGEKAVRSLCNMELVEAVLASKDLSDQELYNKVEGKDICQGHADVVNLHAFNMYNFFRDYELAAKYYYITWHTEGSVEAARDMTVLMMSRAKHRDIAITMWLDVAKHAEKEEMRNYALLKLEREKNFLEIEKANKLWRQQHGSYTQDLQELVDAGLLEAVFLQDPFTNDMTRFAYGWNEEEERAYEEVVK